jgi:nicotinamidase-related amidase
MQLNRKKSALLVIDMQKFFLDPSSPTFTSGGLAILPTVKSLVRAFRDARRPVIYTRHVHHPDRIDAGIMGWWWEGMCLEGSPESELHPDISPLPHEKVISKHRYSAFYNTDLEIILRCLKVRDLVVSGVMTNICCESTARDAYHRDYRVFFLAYGFAFVTTATSIIRQLK